MLHHLEVEEEWHAPSVATATGSGTNDLVVTALQCYASPGRALELKEDVVVKIDDLRANGAGHMEVTGNGITASICSNKDFTKSGFEITKDLSDSPPTIARLHRSHPRKYERGTKKR